MLELYLKIGVLYYIYMAITNAESYKEATTNSILKGLIYGILLWPAVMYLKRGKDERITP
jgi:hypothetical protein